MKNTQKTRLIFIGLIVICIIWASSLLTANTKKPTTLTRNAERVTRTVSSVIEEITPEFGATEKTPAPPLVKSARKQIGVTVRYDPAYVKLKYPMGDVPQDRGVCTDVIIRAYRDAEHKDLQKLVHQDMQKAWEKYPKSWGLKTTDKNIDHRRVPNLRVFFTRHGKKLKVSQNPQDYKAGEIVTWKVQGLPHIGIVSNKVTKKGVPLIIHNIGRGTKEENMIFDYPITGHYRF
ncbi:MAG: DUF1287 domain-containing protein [Moraxellaceae bacterium]|nr:DUF1287 domain-containing protein [Moraxellaceae bacterium]